jgi:hypothetical protein
MVAFCVRVGADDEGWWEDEPRENDDEPREKVDGERTRGGGGVV